MEILKPNTEYVRDPTPYYRHSWYYPESEEGYYTGVYAVTRYDLPISVKYGTRFRVAFGWGFHSKLPNTTLITATADVHFLTKDPTPHTMPSLDGPSLVVTGQATLCNDSKLPLEFVSAWYVFWAVLDLDSVPMGRIYGIATGNNSTPGTSLAYALCPPSFWEDETIETTTTGFREQP